MIEVITISTYLASSTYGIEVPDMRTASVLIHFNVICKFGHIFAQIFARLQTFVCNIFFSLRIF